MRTARQLASGIAYAVVSSLLVIGSIALSLAQGGQQRSPTSTAILPAASVTPRPTARPTGAFGSTSTFAPTVVSTVETATDTLAAATQPAPTSTYVYPTPGTTYRATSTRMTACGPYTGWVHAYIVQPGDTLFRIATMHGTTVVQLQRANCKTGTLIYAGERLWVPFMLPPATELTIIPTFDTPTEPWAPTEDATPTSTATEGVDP